MKVLYALAAFASCTLAQNALILRPEAGQVVAPGDDLVVQVLLPDTTSSDTQIGLVIALADCAYTCYLPNIGMGTVLYNGAFDPVYHETYLPPYQNFTVTVPSKFPAGNLQVNVAHFSLVGAGPTPVMETFNQTIVVT
ncbi:hypothetical protein N7478_008431 [Penicillium angulare]|uniref:uncharacterized protein n=1 Tax=Penicillium angulare TaxID=116970 RepID=UPI002540CB3A|nr:uncharacterized protein N7478_008431 [Penicillium angulare]KAJ5273306.1 hypothetical protein N7478_008431 [Penicillium angulare]